MPIGTIARRLLGGTRRPAPRRRPAPGPAGPGGAASTDAQVGRAARKGLRRLLR